MEPDQLAEKYGDRRPLAEMQFALDVVDENNRRVAADEIRTELSKAGVVVADDIDGLGCTGLVARGLHLDQAAFIRRHWAGAAHVLPCYVGPDRYCLVHDTIGGLQENQEARFPEKVEAVSRALTAEEAERVGRIQRARRTDTSKQALDLLRSRAVVTDVPAAVEAPKVTEAVQDWTCPEHKETVWSCRFCIASEVVQSALEPQLLALPAYGGRDGMTSEIAPVAPAEVPKVIQEHDERGAHALGIFVKAVRYERRFVKS